MYVGLNFPLNIQRKDIVLHIQLPLLPKSISPTHDAVPQSRPKTTGQILENSMYDEQRGARVAAVLK